MWSRSVLVTDEALPVLQCADDKAWRSVVGEDAPDEELRGSLSERS